MSGFNSSSRAPKTGKGVDKDTPQKKRFFYFFELFFRKFWKLIMLNMLYILYCVPIITIGPATVALFAVLRNFSLEKPVFLSSDFSDEFKRNFKQGFFAGLINAVVGFFIIASVYFYLQMVAVSKIFYVFLFITFALAFILITASFYLFTMISVVDQSLKQMIKNALLIAIVSVKTNILTIIALLFSTLLIVMITCAQYITAYGIMWIIAYYLMIGIALSAFVIVFNSYQYIEKYVIEPYYQKTGEKRPDEPDYSDIDEEDFVIFEDWGSKETSKKSDENDKN